MSLRSRFCGSRGLALSLTRMAHQSTLGRSMESAASGSRRGPQKLEKIWLCKYASLFDPEIYEVAFCNVRYRTGWRKKILKAGIEEPSLETFFNGMVPGIIQQMRDRSFQFQPIRKETILLGEGNSSVVGTPSLMDEVIQEALRLVLQPAFVKSYGDASTHSAAQQSALATLQRVRSWTGTTWLIAANMSRSMNNLDHTVMANLILREVKDQQIVDLYWKLVNAGLVNIGNQEPHNLTAVSKGGILWPLFTNIYLSDFDIWLNDLISTLSWPASKPQLKPGVLARNSMSSSSKGKKAKGQEMNMKEMKWEGQDVGTRVHYIRYRDQWAVGVDGPKSVAVKIRDEIGLFLNAKLKLKLEIESITITHVATEKARFLAMLIGTRDKKYVESLVGEKAEQAYGRIVIEAPINEIVTKLVERGFALNPEWPRGMSAWIHLEAEEIMRRYRSITRSLMNYYCIVDNKNMMRRVFWLLRFSAIFTLCRKWRITTKALFKKLANDPRYEDYIKGRVRSSTW